LGYEVRLGQVQLIERTIEENPLRVQHRPHRAVADEDAGVERFKEGNRGHKLPWYLRTPTADTAMCSRRSAGTNPTPAAARSIARRFAPVPRSGDDARTGAAAVASPSGPR